MSASRPLERPADVTASSVPPRDDLLRAAVYGFPAAGTLEERSAAAQRVIDVHRLWPLIDYEHAIERAKAELERLRRHEEAVELAWYDALPTFRPARRAAA